MNPKHPFPGKNLRSRSTVSAFAVWITCAALLVLQSSLAARELMSVSASSSGLVLEVSDGTIELNAISDSAFELLFTRPGEQPFPSKALADPQLRHPVNIEEDPNTLRLNLPHLRAVVIREPFSIRYERADQLLLAEQAGYFDAEEIAGGFRFRLADHEVLMGGGERVLGMDRRGKRLELYNKPSYGYETEAELMYYSMPVVISSAGYMLAFDNGARGYMDLGASDAELLEFGAEGGRMSYIVVAAPSWQGLAEAFTEVTGRQPLPPRWALGNISSRMGYRSQAEVEWVADGYKIKDIPVDAIVLDLYWFGQGLFGHMGNLDWDRETFPRPDLMLERLREQGIKTILITEPFILKTSKNWDTAVAKGLLGTTADGDPYVYDFYFGTTGLLDIFKTETREWFWDFYRDMTRSGVAGWWGDLGEPEVHPDELHHVAGRAPEVHNIYGHEWARLIAEGYAADIPDQRPVILMRSGFVGSQRHGMIPWSGDVNRTWGGLKPQVEIALQMSLQGLAWMHSDLGGFAGDEFDAELYTRWLQYGVFQPVYRPHAQENVPPEPIFWDHDTLAILRPFIKLRYALTPYNYTLAWHNSRSGLPMMRPLFYVDKDPALLHRTDGYLWGDAFLVYPITDPAPEVEEGETPLVQSEVYFPDNAAAWFDFFTGERYTGGNTTTIATPLERLPVFVRAGAWVPMIPEVHTLDLYPYDHKILHYWHDESVRSSNGQIYEDDGVSPGSMARGEFEVFALKADFSPGDEASLQLRIERSGGGFDGRAEEQQLDWIVHQLPGPPSSAILDGDPLESVALQWNAERRELHISTRLSNRSQLIELRF